MKLISDVKFVPTGSTLLNLTLSDRVDGGLALGRIANVIGDASTGKTMLGLSVLAEAAHLREFENHHLIYDDTEAALAIDVGRMFGGKLANRLEFPTPDVEFSDTVENFYRNILWRIGQGEPFIYVLDSFDALATEEDEETAAALQKTGQVKGGYGVAKAKMASQILRHINSELKNLDSLLIIISQTRQDLTSVFSRKIRSGGRALGFYTSYEIWLTNKGRIKVSDTVVGNMVQAEVTKNKITGKIRKVEFPIYYEYGIDDVGSMVDFLLNFGKWRKKNKLTVVAEFSEDLILELTPKKLIKEIEANPETFRRLRELVAAVWQEHEERVSMRRKPKYE